MSLTIGPLTNFGLLFPVVCFLFVSGKRDKGLYSQVSEKEASHAGNGRYFQKNPKIRDTFMEIRLGWSNWLTFVLFYTFLFFAESSEQEEP